MEYKTQNTIKSFSDLEVWQEAHKLVLLIYKATKDFPKEEVFGLVSQMRRAAVSITSNIAEGFSRYSYKEKINFYSISRGSLTELENQLLISKDVGYINGDNFNIIMEQLIVTHKLLNAFIRSTKLPNSKFQIPNSTKGFTVIELIVSMSLFVIISGIIVGSFITATRTQRAIISLIEARDNMGIAMEQMAREVRLGTNFDVNLSNAIGNGISFYDLNGDQISYIFDENNGVLLRQKNSEAPLPITSNDLTIKNFRSSYISYFGVPRITVSFSVIPKDSNLKDNFSFNIQTTISGRQF